MADYRFPALQNGLTLYLASASPRRRELLGDMGIAFTLSPCEVDEHTDPAVHPADAVVLLSERKARAAHALHTHEDTIILASDTLVELDGVPLGKPKNEAHAKEMLLSLSGKTHHVHTGVAVIYRGRVHAARDTTAVHMRAFNAVEAEDYIATGEPMDKAGAYGIQGLGGRLVEGIGGEFDTVVGLPTKLVDELLCRALLHPEEGDAL
ncbi:MAG: septum formation protein Maf [Clostridia bacterium]|nr:septum formation protein Maf [Clostridia bacterium]